MPRAPKDDQLNLFPGMAAAPATLPIRPWRTAQAEDWLPDESKPEWLESFLIDLLRRNRELLKALSLAGVPDDAPGVARIRRQESPLISQVVELRQGKLSAIAGRDLLSAARRTAERLATTRREILEGLDPEPRERVIKAEPRVRVDDFALLRELAEAQFAVAEEEDIIEIEMPLAGLLPSGFLEIADVDALAQHSMVAWKEEQDQRPLPRQLRLKTLLKGIPAIWLDPVCTALGIEPDEFRNRKDREQAVARILADADRLHEIVRDQLSAKERELVAYLLEKGGQAASGVVKRRFGRDDEDGWFWNEQPPTSVLGRLRLHGLAFVGRLPVKGRKVRSVAIPRELRETLGAALEDATPS